MGKKITTLLSTLTLAAGGLASVISPPPALATSENGISLDDYWSFSEILELKTEIENAAKTSCGENYECKVEYRRQEILSHYKEDSRYLLVGQAIDNNFLITGINPTAETVTIYYNDENMMDWEFMGESHSHLKDIYLAWAEEGYPDMRNSRVSFNDGGKNRSGPIYVADANNGTTTEKVHLVFTHRPKDGNPADTWLHYGEENILDATGSSLINDTRHMLHFSVYAYEGFSAVGAVDYNMFAESYRPGMEYKLMYDKNNLFEYWVPQYADGEEPTEGTINPTEELTSPTESQTSQAEVPTTPVETTEVSKEPTNPTPSDKAAFTISVKQISTSGMRVPTTPVKTSLLSSKSATGTSTDASLAEDQKNCTQTEKTDDNNLDLPLTGGIDSQNSGEEEHIFPWWIIVLLFSGIALTFWWFVPIKKYEKSIDK